MLQQIRWNGSKKKTKQIIMKIGYQRTDCSIRPKVTTIDTPPHKTNKGKEKDEKRKENEKAKTSYIFFLTDVRSLSCLILCAEC
jgi:hypothetical protein